MRILDFRIRKTKLCNHFRKHFYIYIILDGLDIFIILQILKDSFNKKNFQIIWTIRCIINFVNARFLNFSVITLSAEDKLEKLLKNKTTLWYSLKSFFFSWRDFELMIFQPTIVLIKSQKIYSIIIWSFLTQNKLKTRT